MNSKQPERQEPYTAEKIMGWGVGLILIVPSSISLVMSAYYLIAYMFD